MRSLLLAAALFTALAAPLLPEESASPRREVSRRDAVELISLDLKEADLKDVLRTFAKLTKLNIAIDPEVKGSVTLRLHDVPWDQALEIILRINSLGYVLEGNILRVGTPGRLLAGD